ncbi:hypothetical protein HYH03_013981 [Edaphochlamys debaryana]|uniref:Uncharacterized protein n=1 Tax=Edaphochlamys debaryana TaxID=47281 RepID=A0A835XM68_9CHLO|nr:hypothetical protein HYH03_013981 [Edaphochlamys debaryana]|eukprot:KAG2487412.1 hypothetical protein HYH03_013981 [Edaphochlamys debaryana]
MQATLELTSPQQPHDGPGPATEGRSPGARLGNGGGSCAHATEAAAAAAEPGAAGPAAEGEADWSWPPRDEFEPVLSLLPPRCLLHAALTCRGWAAVAAHSLGGRRRAQARDRWAEAARAIPHMTWALAEAGAGAEEVERLAELESPPAPLSQLFWALEVLWPRCQERLGRWGRGEEEIRQAIWQIDREVQPPAGAWDPPGAESADDFEDGAWRVDDPSWRHNRWEAARALMRSPDFPLPGLRVALPLGPRTLARLRSRTGGAGGPGPQPPPLVAEEVAVHSKAAGRLAEWLLGARELSRAALEAEAAHAWDWPQRLVRRSTGGQAGAAGTSAAAAPASGSAGCLAEWLLGARELSRAALEAEAAHAWDWPQRLVRRSTGGGQAGAGPSNHLGGHDCRVSGQRCEAWRLCGGAARLFHTAAMFAVGRDLNSSQALLQRLGVYRAELADLVDQGEAPEPHLPAEGASAEEVLAAAAAWAGELSLAAAGAPEALQLRLGRSLHLLELMQRNYEGHLIMGSRLETLLMYLRAGTC